MINTPKRTSADRRAHGDPIKDQHVANERIRTPTVRLIDASGKNLGVCETRSSMLLARDQGLDLVVISPAADPPVARICDYNKFIYEQKQSKKENDRKLRENAIVVKEIQLRPNIGAHDLDVKMQHAREWLGENCRIKIVVKFKGREMAHKARGFDVIKGFLEKLDCKVEKDPDMNNNTIIAMIAPVATKISK